MKTGTDMWVYNPTHDAQRSWVGYDVHATDGDIGTIDEMSTEVGRGCVIVDTGFWIFGKKRLIPAGTVRSVDHENRRVDLTLTKDQVKDAPDYDAVRREDDAYWSETARYYGRHV
jgi:hypothetical protein